jgi:hypothetical protein
MRLQHQTKFGGASAPIAERGNCFATCLASVLGIDLALVPNFAEAETDEEFNARSRAWARERGLALITFGSPDGFDDAVFIATGRGPRGHMHCVLWRNGELFHDPIPGGTGLSESPGWFDLFVIVDGERFREAIAREQLAAEGFNVGGVDLTKEG